MKKVLFFLIPLLLVIIVLSGVSFYLSRESGKGALQVTSNPKASVYLNGKLIGQAPLCKCEAADMLAVGDYNIRLVTEDNSLPPFEEKIKISPSVLTVVDRTFGRGASGEGSVISLSKLNNPKSSELLIISFPDNAQTFVNNNASKDTPLLLKDLIESDHEIKLTKDGYKEKIIRIRTIPGYKLTVLAYLGVNPVIENITPSPDLKSDKNNSTPSASASTVKVLILQTPTGFLRVREDASVGSAEVARVIPGDTLKLIEEKGSWFKVKLEDGKEGWISAQYAKKQ